MKKTLKDISDMSHKQIEEYAQKRYLEITELAQELIQEIDIDLDNIDQNELLDYLEDQGY